MMFFKKYAIFVIFWGIKGEMHMISGLTAVTMTQGERAVTRLQLEE